MGVEEGGHEDEKEGQEEEEREQAKEKGDLVQEHVEEEEGDEEEVREEEEEEQQQQQDEEEEEEEDEEEEAPVPRLAAMIFSGFLIPVLPPGPWALLASASGACRSGNKSGEQIQYLEVPKHTTGISTTRLHVLSLRS